MQSTSPHKDSGSTDEDENTPEVHYRRDTFDQLDRPGSIQINVRGAFIVDEDDFPSSVFEDSSVRSRSSTRDIRLPYHKADVSHLAVDIGGSLAKLVYFTRDPSGNGGKLIFKSFETEKIDDLIYYMQRLISGAQSTPKTLCNSKEEALFVMATGGGAYKFYEKIKHELCVEIYREDEMECLIVEGLDFFITEIPYEVFTYSDEDPMQFSPARTDIYPYLLVNIGSGVSIIKVSDPQNFERIGGSSLGGGTLWGILSLLTNAKTFDEMLSLAAKGDNAKVDMLVGDIYGGGYGRIGLKATTIASSFGKVFRKQIDATSHVDNGRLGDSCTERFSQEDLSRSLLYAVSNNIGQIAYLQAQNHNLKHIYFGGSFIRGHRQTMNALSYAIRFWSNNNQKAYFLRHEGYLGAVGAFLRKQPRNWGRRNSTSDEPRNQNLSKDSIDLC